MGVKIKTKKRGQRRVTSIVGRKHGGAMQSEFAGYHRDFEVARRLFYAQAAQCTGMRTILTAH